MSKEQATEEDVIRTAIKMVIERVREHTYLPEYRANISESEIMGVILSKYFEWSGRKIAEATYSAFEDSNFHTFNEKFNELWKANRKDDDDLWEVK